MATKAYILKKRRTLVDDLLLGDGEAWGIMRECVQCLNPIDTAMLSFEQRLIDDQDFCRRCFDEKVDGEDLTYLESSRFLLSNR